MSEAKINLTTALSDSIRDTLWAFIRVDFSHSARVTAMSALPGYFTDLPTHRLQALPDACRSSYRCSRVIKRVSSLLGVTLDAHEREAVDPPDTRTPSAFVAEILSRHGNLFTDEVAQNLRQDLNEEEGFWLLRAYAQTCWTGLGCFRNRNSDQLQGPMPWWA